MNWFGNNGHDDDIERCSPSFFVRTTCYTLNCLQPARSPGQRMAVCEPHATYHVLHGVNMMWTDDSDRAEIIFFFRLCNLLKTFTVKGGKEIKVTNGKSLTSCRTYHIPKPQNIEAGTETWTHSQPPGAGAYWESGCVDTYVTHLNNNNNYNNNCIQRRNLRFFTISSLHREPSPAHTLKWPRRNRVQITCNTSRT